PSKHFGCGFFLWKETRIRQLMSSPGALSVGPSTPPSHSSGPSIPSNYSSGLSTPPNYSSRSSRNAECSNCKHLRGKISALKATMNMHMHPEQHTVNSAALLHEVLNEIEKLDLEYLRNILDVDFLWKETRIRQLMSSPGALSVGPSTPPSHSSGPSIPPSYSSGLSTPPNYSSRSSRNAECSNCKHLRGKISALKATMNMHMHPEQHIVNSAALLQKVLNEMEKLDLE
nr:hypothetical protein [Tanacetum cinerariifolium]